VRATTTTTHDDDVSDTRDTRAILSRAYAARHSPTG
jgi:hypothetical protein